MPSLCEPGDPGVPWAIGSEAGGHKAIDPTLGTLQDFDWLQAESAQSRNGNRARFRDQLLARSSLRQGASGMVLQATRWLDQIRRKSAEEIRGHLSR